MIRTALWTRAAGLAVLLLAAAAAAGAPDRLERFRVLAGTQLATTPDSDETADAYREIYALLDEEIVDNLASGGVFASLAFLQDRLDAFGEVWGATVVRLHRIGPLVVGAFELSDDPRGNTVRVYGELAPANGVVRPRGDAPRPVSSEPALLATLVRDGQPHVYPLPAAERGASQFLVVWEGPPSGHGARGVRVDQVRQVGDGVRVVWSTADAFPSGLDAAAWSVRGSEVRVHYGSRYPGWTPGCEGQTSQEDLYRLGPSGTFARVTRREVNAWHRQLRVTVSEVLDALRTGDAATLATLVPDARIRSLLPRSLEAEPACDAREPGAPERVSVAARAGRMPWQLVFQRGAGGWRVVRASPVLPTAVLE